MSSIILLFARQCYTAGMSYDVGTYIDLSYLNKKQEVVAATPHKKSAFKKTLEAASSFQEVGTQYVFDQATGRFGRRIPVSFA